MPFRNIDTDQLTKQSKYAIIYMLFLKDANLSTTTNIYIGRTTVLLKSRLKTHFHFALRYPDRQTKLFNKIREYPDFSKWDYYILTECPAILAPIYEKLFIDSFDTFNHGLNSRQEKKHKRYNSINITPEKIKYEFRTKTQSDKENTLTA
jgi:hypothetical protein